MRVDRAVGRVGRIAPACSLPAEIRSTIDLVIAFFFKVRKLLLRSPLRSVV